ncbi:DNA repair protein RadC, partial [candidate division WWE3 bacterium]|nr:DNA repair protein RadC [candidate division WWE3 bacterium]
MINSRIRDLNKDEKPREKFINKGAVSLTDEELIALLLCTGGTDLSAIDLAREILKSAGGLANLNKYDIQKLLSHKYVNSAKAVVIKAAVEIARRINYYSAPSTKQIIKPEDVFNILRKDFIGQTKECLMLISIDSRNKFISKDVISVGSINETIVSPREIFAVALNKNAACIIIAHNHPSNDPAPSNEDINVTKKISTLGKAMNIPLLD